MVIQRIQKTLQVPTWHCLREVLLSTSGYKPWCVALYRVACQSLSWDMIKRCRYLRHKMRLKQSRDGIKRIPRPFLLFAVTSNHPFTNFLVSNQLDLTRHVFGIMLFASTLVDKRKEQTNRRNRRVANCSSWNPAESPEHVTPEHLVEGRRRAALHLFSKQNSFERVNKPS